MDEREQAIAEVVSLVRQYESPAGCPGFEVIRAASRLADIESPPLPDEIEVLVTRSRTDGEPDYFPDGWRYLYGLSCSEVEVEEDLEVYRCRLTPLARVK